MSSQDLISIFYVIISVKVALELIRQRRYLFSGFITSYHSRLTVNAAFFFLVPIGVFLHELGHAIAIWYFGGTVTDFEWRIFWGYVASEGDFTDVERWWISFSGNLVSIVLGLISLHLYRYFGKPFFRSLVRNFARLQIVFSLVVYPLFSLIAVGDWARIYNFSLKPYSQITLGLHILLLFYLRRKGVFGVSAL